MYKLSLFLSILCVLFFNLSCEKEILDQTTAQKENFKSDTLLNEVRDSLDNSGLLPTIDALGVLRWEEANAFFQM